MNDVKYAMSVSTFMREENFEKRFAIFKECINSFCDSSFEGTLHIVDDCSETKIHLHWVGQKNDPRIVVHQKQVNGGVAKTKNTGIRLCLEDPNVDVFFLSDDDMIYDTVNWYETYIDAIKKTSIKHFSYALPSCARKNAREVKVNGVGVLQTNHVNGCFLVGTRTLIEEVGFFKILPHKYGHEHSNFSIRCKQLCGSFYDTIDSVAHLKLNGESHDNKSIVVNKTEMDINSRYMWDNKKEECIE